ncbi:MAG: tRNA 2-selenouridine(34) synthase MnmH [Caulobacteraceae bacterium]
MFKVTDQVDFAALARFDDIIDVRSPGEFAEDHVSGAINLPVLSDAERIEVGTIYVQESKFTAKRIGAAHIARNIAAHLQGPLSDKGGGWAPVLYCWRGGQRSHAMATVLDQIGWRTTLITGGYKTYRAGVTAALYEEAAAPLRLVLLDGNTGSAKTEILHRLPGVGVQMLDLEGLAGHRGSLFGGVSGQPQPSQRLFESRLYAALAQLDPARPIVVEAESSRIGDRAIPSGFWRAMTSAPRIEIHASQAERARYLARTYLDIGADVAALEEAIARLPRHHSHQQKQDWRDMARTGQVEPLAHGLIAAHYDPAYARSAGASAHASLGVITLDRLDPDQQQSAAEQIARLVS